MANPLLPEKKLQLNQRVQVYRNVRKEVFSVLDGKTRRLIAHSEALVLANVEFKVSRAGQAQVRREKQKNVHAYVIGDYAGQEGGSLEHYELVYYNPYTTETFVTLENHLPVLKAERCYLVNGKCYIKS
ncbi:hypothetical protein [Domibacillus indicus]|uniref:hypothetical protein n=1 Tax=Domibacillus indicus TaxID=1437523 RepID=UPI0006971520|nr:hypothetical protein [Domibacillus indicus]